jgi:1-acyl-sn-glycerol-3-phosphate acyltransferase
MTTFDSFSSKGDTVLPPGNPDSSENALIRQGPPGEVTHVAERCVSPTAPLATIPATIPAKFTLSSVLLAIAYPLGLWCVVPLYFGRIRVSGREHLPQSGPVILAPTHRSRWDAVLVPYAAGYHVTGRHLRFMVTSDEMRGIQGWLIRRLGGFSVDVKHPAIASLRHGVKLLQERETLVIFPEGDIFRGQHVHPLKPGLARLAMQAETSQPMLDVKILPIYFEYSHAMVPWRSRVQIRIGAPIRAAHYLVVSPKQGARQLTADLQDALETMTDKTAAPRLPKIQSPKSIAPAREDQSRSSH